MKKSSWRKNGKKMAVIVLLWVCMLCPIKSQAQAETPIGLYPVWIMDNSGEAQYFGPGVCVMRNNAHTVFSLGGDDSLQIAEMAIQIEDTAVWLKYSDADESFSIWEVREDSLQNLAGYEDAFLYSGVFSQGENAVAYYHYVSNGEVFEGSTQVTLRGINGQGFLEADGYPTGVLYPASLVNGQNQIIGILLGDNLCLPVGQSADAAAPATAAPLPGRTTGSAAGGAASSGGVSGILVAAGVIGAVVLVLLIVLILILAGRKKTPQGNGSQQSLAGSPVSAGIPVPSPGGGRKDIEKKQRTGKLWLLARGGCMNGRVYPVGQSEITIGRDAAMVIRFPADTVGVSRIHAKLYWQGGQLMLMDCNSTSGTYLKRQGKLTPMAPVAVQGGDIFYIGEKLNSFEISTGE